MYLTGEEIPLRISCEGETLIGICHRPRRARRLGLIIVVGGPQYRVGSHRQFVLLSRALAERGYPVLRFDCRGMGDSSGTFPGFEGIDADIRSAIDTLMAIEKDMDRIVLWGLCDGAAAALLHVPGDARIAGLVLLNPWVTTGGSRAQTLLQSYYLSHALHGEFWRRIMRGDVRTWPAIREFLAHAITALSGWVGKLRPAASGKRDPETQLSFVDRMLAALNGFVGKTQIILSGNDLTAAEFRTLASTTPWRRIIERRPVSIAILADANHTFATNAWRDHVARITGDFLDSLDSDSRTHQLPHGIDTTSGGAAV